MLTGIALVLIGIYAVLPKAISITLIVFGAVCCSTSLWKALWDGYNKEK